MTEHILETKIKQYMQESLNEKEQEDFEQHISQCVACQSLFETFTTYNQIETSSDYEIADGYEKTRKVIRRRINQEVLLADSFKFSMFAFKLVTEVLKVSLSPLFIKSDIRKEKK